MRISTFYLKSLNFDKRVSIPNGSPSIFADFIWLIAFPFSKNEHAIWDRHRFYWWRRVPKFVKWEALNANILFEFLKIRIQVSQVLMHPYKSKAKYADSGEDNMLIVKRGKKILSLKKYHPKRDFEWFPDLEEPKNIYWLQRIQ